MNTRFPRITPLLAVVLATACSYTNLEGDYEGEVECDGGSVGAAMEVEESGTAYYSALLNINPITLDGVPTSFVVEFDIEQTAANGGQTLNADDAACTGVTDAGATSTIDCSGFSELGFDGENTISADISNFLGTGLDCALTLER